MGFFETLLSGFLLSIFGGLVWFAYKHPKGYSRLWYPLFFLAVVLLVVVAAYQFGREWAMQDAMSAIESADVRNAVREALNRSDINMLWAIAGYGAFMVIHYFLGLVLPRLVEADKDEK